MTLKTDVCPLRNGKPHDYDQEVPAWACTECGHVDMSTLPGYNRIRAEAVREFAQESLYPDSAEYRMAIEYADKIERGEE